MTDKDLFNIGVGAEPPIVIDFAAIEAVADARIRRRRTYTVIAAASVAAMVALGVALIPHVSSGSGPNAASSIPGCGTVVTTTTDASSITSTSPAPSMPAGSPSPVAPAVASTSTTAGQFSDTVSASPPAPSMPAGSPSSAAPAVTSTTTSTTAGQFSDTVSASDTESRPAAGTTARGSTSPATADLDQAPDPVTAALWKQLASWQVSVRKTSQYGQLVFQGGQTPAGQPVSIIATGRVTAPNGGDGQVSINIRSDRGGVPACQVGELDRRVVYADGTVVDILEEKVSAESNLDGADTPIMTTHATAYRTDGSTVIVRVDNAVQIHDDHPEEAGTTTSSAPPLNPTQVQDLATDPAFALSNPDMAQVPAQTLITIPDVLGLTPDEAIATLQAAGLYADSIVIAPPAESDATPPTITVVTDQQPAAGEAATPYDTVELTTALTSAAPDVENTAPTG